MKVDKERGFDNQAVSYFEIPPKNIAELSEVFLKERFHEARKTILCIEKINSSFHPKRIDRYTGYGHERTKDWKLFSKRG